MQSNFVGTKPWFGATLRRETVVKNIFERPPATAGFPEKPLTEFF